MSAEQHTLTPEQPVAHAMFKRTFNESLGELAFINNDAEWVLADGVRYSMEVSACMSTLAIFLRGPKRTTAVGDFHPARKLVWSLTLTGDDIGEVKVDSSWARNADRPIVFKVQYLPQRILDNIKHLFPAIYERLFEAADDDSTDSGESDDDDDDDDKGLMEPVQPATVRPTHGAKAPRSASPLAVPPLTVPPLAVPQPDQVGHKAPRPAAAPVVDFREPQVEEKFPQLVGPFLNPREESAAQPADPSLHERINQWGKLVAMTRELQPLIYVRTVDDPSKWDATLEQWILINQCCDTMIAELTLVRKRLFDVIRKNWEKKEKTSKKRKRSKGFQRVMNMNQ